jgi:hypothetical protein
LDLLVPQLMVVVLVVLVVLLYQSMLDQMDQLQQVAEAVVLLVPLVADLIQMFIQPIICKVITLAVVMVDLVLLSLRIQPK